MSTDIQNHSWIENLPQSWRPYVYLGRFDRPIGIWLLLLPGWWAIALASEKPWQSWHLFLLFGLGAIVMRAAGCVVNDMWDRELDQQVRRTVERPLASGALSMRQAAIFLGVLLFLGFLVLVQMNVFTIMLGVVSLPMIVLYPLMKRFTWWPQAFLGLVFNFGVLMGWSAVVGYLELPALLMYLGCVFWTLGYDTIYAHQDVEDDALVGVKSTALRFRHYTRPMIALFYGLQSVLWSAAFFMAAGWLAVVFLIPAFVHLYRQVFSFEDNNPDLCLRIFKSNRDLGLLVLAGCLIAGMI